MKSLIKTYTINSSLEEQTVWNDDIAPWLPTLPENVKNIWEYAFTEIFNNAIDHSDGNKIQVDMQKRASGVQVSISDDGVGIFKKIQNQRNLSDPRHAALELAKGKLTTDPNNHSGEGVFFTARMMDVFAIFSGQVFYSHHGVDDWIEKKIKTKLGTHVVMYLDSNDSCTVQDIFNEFASKDGEFQFNKTIVPVQLAEYGDSTLISRSQAKRLMAGLDKFNLVMLDFSQVKAIGQAFADEVFRVFAKRHPDINIQAVNPAPDVQKMINRALNHSN